MSRRGRNPSCTLQKQPLSARRPLSLNVEADACVLVRAEQFDGLSTIRKGVANAGLIKVNRSAPSPRVSTRMGREGMEHERR
jgi:hypothetical protein